MACDCERLAAERDEARQAIIHLLLSADASWAERGEGHDWKEAVRHAESVLGPDGADVGALIDLFRILNPEAVRVIFQRIESFRVDLDTLIRSFAEAGERLHKDLSGILRRP